MYQAGFDYSWLEASFAVKGPEGKLLFEETLALPPRNASGLPDWMGGLLKKHGLTLNDIQEWSVGNGPGSFTGLRVAAAFVLGVTCCKDVRIRAVSTAGAMADSLNLPENVTNVLALFDGRRDDLLAFGLKRSAGGTFAPSGVHAVLNRNSLELLKEFNGFIALEKDGVKIREVAGAALHSELTTAAHVSASSLIENSKDLPDIPLTDPVYLRPAVFVEPRIPRNVEF